jgi:hypothetical protein
MLKELAKTRENLSIWNMWPCGCYDVQTKSDGLLANFCRYNPSLNIYAPRVSICNQWHEQHG